MRWLLERALPWHSDSCDDGEDWGGRGRLALSPAGRYGAILLWYRAGVHAVEGAFQEHTESWLSSARCYRDALPMLLEASCATEEDLVGAAAEAVTGAQGQERRSSSRSVSQQGRSSRATLWDRARGCVHGRKSKSQSTTAMGSSSKAEGGVETQRAGRLPAGGRA